MEDVLYVISTRHSCCHAGCVSPFLFKCHAGKDLSMQNVAARKPKLTWMVLSRSNGAKKLLKVVAVDTNGIVVLIKY